MTLTTKQERQALRDLFTQSYQKELSELQDRMTRMGLNSNSPAWVEEAFRLQIQYENKLKRISRADRAESIDEDKPWPYSTLHE